MGEYECWDCDEKFHLEEPPYDGREICDQCREDYKNRFRVMENDLYKDLSDGEVLDIIFAKFGIEDDDNATEQLLRKIDKLLEGTNG